MTPFFRLVVDMLRRSEDLFLDELDGVLSSVIRSALERVEEGDCDAAQVLLKPLVENGNGAAIYYSSCFGVSAESLDEFEARRIRQLIQSAESGYPPAIHELAVHYDSGELVLKDVEKAAALFKQAAEKGHPHAQWIHGIDLLYGRSGVEKNEGLGVQYVIKSAEAKFEGALESVSEFYERGMHGFPLDVDRAKCFRDQLDDEDVLGY